MRFATRLPRPMAVLIAAGAALALLAACSGGDASTPSNGGGGGGGGIGGNSTPAASPVNIEDYTASVARGGTASLTAKATENQECTIRVLSAVGTVVNAEGLDPATADAEGNVTWEWVIADNAIAGSNRATVNCGGATDSVNIRITAS